MENKTEDQKIKSYLESENNDSFSSEDFSNKKKNKKLLLVSFFVVVLITIIGYFSLMSGHDSFSEDKVVFNIDAPKSMQSGDEISISFECKNNNEVDLKDVKIELDFPEGFVFESSDQELVRNNNRSYFYADEISKGASARIKVFGILVGGLDEQKKFSANLRYKPSNFNYDFTLSSDAVVNISEVPVSLDYDIPEALDNNDDFKINISYHNDSERNFDKAELRLIMSDDTSSYSADKDFTTSSEASNVLVFNHDNFTSGSFFDVNLSAFLKSENESFPIGVEVYLLEENGEFVRYITENKLIEVKNPDVIVNQIINDTSDYIANKNDTLKYKITFRNQSEEAIKGLVLKTNLEGEFDFSTLKAEKGSVKDNVITWSALNVPELAVLEPEQEGVVEFEIKVNDRFEIDDKNDKNFSLVSKTELNIIDSNSNSSQISKLVSTNNLETKIKAFVSVTAKGYFNDDGRIENSGSIPPKVGEETSYTIHWTVKNLFNDTQDIRITSILPENVELTGLYIDSENKIQSSGIKDIYSDVNEEGDNNEGIGTQINILEEGQDLYSKFFDENNKEDIYYNSHSREIIWYIPALNANDGILTSAKEIVFQIKLIPREEDLGKRAEILNKTSAKAFDTFTKQDVFIETAETLTTYLFDDYSISEEESIVVD